MCQASPASLICRNSFLSSLTSSRSRAATSNCSSAAAARIRSVISSMIPASSAAGRSVSTAPVAAALPPFAGFAPSEGTGALAGLPSFDCR